MQSATFFKNYMSKAGEHKTKTPVSQIKKCLRKRLGSWEVWSRVWDVFLSFFR